MWLNRCQSLSWIGKVDDLIYHILTTDLQFLTAFTRLKGTIKSLILTYYVKRFFFSILFDLVLRTVMQKFSKVWTPMPQKFSMVWRLILQKFFEVWRPVLQKFCEPWRPVLYKFCTPWRPVLQKFCAPWRPLLQKFYKPWRPMLSKQDVWIHEHYLDYNLNRSWCNKASLAFAQIMF